MSKGSVTVVIPNFNRTHLLRKSLASIKTQTLRPQEVVIVDDCSHPENLAEIEKIIGDFREELNIGLLKNDANRGANYSRNRGIASVSSEYVAFLDSDDLWMPGKLEIQMAAIRRALVLDGHPVLSATGRYRVNGIGRIITCQFGRKTFDYDSICQSNFIGTLSSVIVDAAVARKVGGFDETLGASQDWDFFIRLAKHVQYVGVSDPLCVYVDHSETRISSNSAKRIVANTQIRRRHSKSESPPNQVQSGVCVRIAEDLQIIGKKRRANLYYAEHLHAGFSRIVRNLVPKFILFCVISTIGAPDLKNERYKRYRINFSKLIRNPTLRKTTALDQQVIMQMMEM